MIEHFLLHAFQALFGWSERKRAEQHDQEVARNAARRKVAHADIPPMHVVEGIHGARSKELIELLDRADPLHLHTRASRRQKDLRHRAYVERRYRTVAWTLIHRLAYNGDGRSVAHLLQQELSLWHGDQKAHDVMRGASALVEAIATWRARWDFR